MRGKACTSDGGQHADKAASRNSVTHDQSCARFNTAHRYRLPTFRLLLVGLLFFVLLVLLLGFFFRLLAFILFL